MYDPKMAPVMTHAYEAWLQ